MFVPCRTTWQSPPIGSTTRSTTGDDVIVSYFQIERPESTHIDKRLRTDGRDYLSTLEHVKSTRWSWACWAEPRAVPGSGSNRGVIQVQERVEGGNAWVGLATASSYCTSHTPLYPPSTSGWATTSTCCIVLLVSLPGSRGLGDLCIPLETTSSTTALVSRIPLGWGSWC